MRFYLYENTCLYTFGYRTNAVFNSLYNNNKEELEEETVLKCTSYYPGMVRPTNSETMPLRRELIIQFLGRATWEAPASFGSQGEQGKCG